MDRRRLLLIIVLPAFTIIVLLVCTSVFLSVPNVFFYNEAAVENIASRIRVTPTFGHIAAYIKSNIQLGWSREQVESFMQSVAPIEVEHGELTQKGGLPPHMCDQLFLVIYEFHGKLSFSACYYEDGKSLFNFRYNQS